MKYPIPTVILSKFYLRTNNGIADDKLFPNFAKSNLWQRSSLAPGVFYPPLSFASGNSVSILVILLSAAFPYGSVPFLSVALLSHKLLNY
jgi:hypothetical protein